MLWLKYHRHLHDCLLKADPHPGNILMMQWPLRKQNSGKRQIKLRPDGRIGLIDFGQCRRLTSDEKAECAAGALSWLRKQKLLLRYGRLGLHACCKR